MPNDQQVIDTGTVRADHSAALKPRPLLTLTVMEDDLQPTWETDDTEKQADVLTRINVWMQDERTKIGSNY
jgi:hypothetical protein